MRHVHLMHFEVIRELQEKGFNVELASMGGNSTTTGVDLLSLPVNSKLSIGDTVVLQLTGLRNQCSFIFVHAK